MLLFNDDKEKDLISIKLNREELDVLKEICLHCISYLGNEIYNSSNVDQNSIKDIKQYSEIISLMTHYKSAGEILTNTMIQFIDN